MFNDGESKQSISDSVQKPNLLKLIEKWLERTPGLVIHSDDQNGSKVESNRFKEAYEKSVYRFLKDTYMDPAEVSCGTFSQVEISDLLIWNFLE